MQLNKTFQYLILLHCIAVVICESYYSIIAPGLIKSNRKYTVAVTLHESSASCDISISILGRSFNASDVVSLQPFETKTLDFFPPKLVKGEYMLVAEGLNGCEIRNQSDLLSDDVAGPKIYIQTDKAIYLPQDLVQFRVVILDEHTRPMNISEPIRVEIFDQKRNRVKQFKDISLNKGVFTGKFKLSQQPVMGEWEIRVVIGGKYSHQKSKQILVQEYTLPKFSVYVDVPDNIILDDPKIRAEFYGKYTFDKYVQGVLDVELLTFDKNKLIERQTHDIDGLAVVEFRIENKEILDGENFLRLNALLKEKITGVRQNVSRAILIQKQRYKIYIPQNEIEFRNNKPFRLKAHVEDLIDGTVWDPMSPVIMTHGSSSYKTYLNNDGIAVFEFDHVKNAPFCVSFKDSKSFFPSFHSYKQADDNIYCKLELKEPPRLGKVVEVLVRSSFNIPYLVYTVVGHGSVVQVEYVKLSGNKKSHTIKLMPSIEMVPKSFLFVHYILDGNLRYGELELKFPNELENQISVEAPHQVKPGQQVTLKVKAEPKSYVSILAVDLSVYLLKNSYDIYKNTILKDLNEDRSYVPNAYLVQPGILSGLITLTNAHFPVRFEFFDFAEHAPTERLDFRTKFPETWIFNNYEINDTVTEITLNIPETITTWRITAFSTNAIKGFGIVDGPTDITTFLPFFLSTSLPRTAKRDESVVIPVSVFNYHNRSVDTDIIMFNDHLEFEFMDPVSNTATTEQQTKSLEIPVNSGKTVEFLIKVLKIGEIDLRIMANSSVYSDGILKKLTVIPEGITKYQNSAQYLSATDKVGSLSLDIPPDTVTDSETITLSIGGDFMIPSLENLHQMIKLPTGCGEQNMVNFAPNVLVLGYLKATRKLSKENKLASLARLYIDTGYQQQLSYRHASGGYSVFGEEHSKEASNWLTAYVIRFFIMASKYAPIEATIIDCDLEYLAQQQRMDGSFPYNGYVFYKGLQNTNAFTAFVLRTFMEDRKYARKYQPTITKGLQFLSSSLDDINDVYALSLIAAVLSKAQHPATSQVMKKLVAYRKEDDNGLMWWSSRGNDIETTAYVLLALVNVPGNHLPILKWLISQQNRQGGFRTSHDTVVGLESLVQFAQKYNNAVSWNLKVSYKAYDRERNEVKVNEFAVNRTNVMTLQQHELPKTVRQVDFEITGNGYCLVQLSSQYNVKNDVELKHFTMEVIPIVYNSIQLDLEICFTYHALNDVNNSTNMVIMEINLPSGFKTEPEVVHYLKQNDFIQRTEVKNDETSMILYFDKLSTEVKHCVTIESFLANDVMHRKPSSIVMYDYYNTNRSNTLFYEI